MTCCSVSASMSEISNYLSLGACMEGLKLLTERLYGVTLQDVTPDPGECWHSSVHKLKVNLYHYNLKFVFMILQLNTSLSNTWNLDSQELASQLRTHM